MKVIITGSSGQLGKSLNLLKPNKVKIINNNKSNLDLSNEKQISDFIKRNNPDWVINCGAYTAVDKAEKESDIAFKVNADATSVISQALLKTNGKLLQISTDFVFDGNKNRPYTPYEKTAPLGIYGLSKLKGEHNIRKIFSNPNQAVILRTSWLMSHMGENFALKILKLHQERDSLNIVSDQIGSPTSTLTLAKTCWAIILFSGNWSEYYENKIPILHWSDSGIASWYDVAVAVGEIGLELGFLKKMADVNPIKRINYQTLAKRPYFSALDTELTKNFLNLKTIHWRQAMLNFLKLLSNLEY